MIPAFNCADTLRATLASVLAQDPGAGTMQIEVVDDYSTADDPEAVVRAFEGRVGFFRQPLNLGVPGNLTACIARAQGELVHLLHGDDLVRPGFYEALDRGFAQSRDIGAAVCNHVYLANGDEAVAEPLAPAAGLLEDAACLLAQEQRIMTPAIAVRRSVYEALGGFDTRLICAEDWEMWVRVASCYPVWYDSQPLAVYRMHDNSNTGRHVRSGEDMKFTRMAIGIFSRHLPHDRAGIIATRARKTYAQTALAMAERLRRQGDPLGCLAQLREAWLLDPSFATTGRAARLAARATLRLG